MAHSVEGRFPFLDRQVAALADALPARYKLRVLDEKHVLKRVAAEVGPCRRFCSGRSSRIGRPTPCRSPVRWPGVDRGGRRREGAGGGGCLRRRGGSPGPRQVSGSRRIGPVLERRQHGGRRYPVDAARSRPADPTCSRGRPRRQAASPSSTGSVRRAHSAAMKETPFSSTATACRCSRSCTSRRRRSRAGTPFVFCHPVRRGEAVDPSLVGVVRAGADCSRPCRAAASTCVGNGDSEGEFEESSLTTALSDTRAAIDLVEAQDEGGYGEPARAPARRCRSRPHRGRA